MKKVFNLTLFLYYKNKSVNRRSTFQSSLLKYFFSAKLFFKLFVLEALCVRKTSFLGIKMHAKNNLVKVLGTTMKKTQVSIEMQNTRVDMGLRDNMQDKAALCDNKSLCPVIRKSRIRNVPRTINIFICQSELQFSSCYILHNSSL